MLNHLGFNHYLLGSSKRHGSLLGLHTPCSPYMISARVELALLHSCCYSWWSSLILTSPKHCDLLLKFGSTFSSNLSEALLVVPGLKFYSWPFQTNAFNYLWGNYQWLLVTSHSVKTQLFSMTPLWLPNQYYLREYYTSVFRLWNEVQP